MAYRVSVVADDVNSDVRALGLDLPLVESGARFKLNYLSIDQAVANAKNLLLTNTGERVMLPNFGCNLQNILFEGLTEERVLEVQSNITEQFAIWLPYVFLNQVNVIPKPDENQLLISVTISLIQNRFDTRSINLIVLPNIPT
jgi:phage baseplate assembly protein W